MNRTLRTTVFGVLLLASVAASTGCGMLTARPIGKESVLVPTRREEAMLKDYQLTARSRRGQDKIREIRRTDAAIQKAREHMTEIRKKSRRFNTPINEIYGVPNARPATTKPTVGIEVH